MSRARAGPFALVSLVVVAGIALGVAWLVGPRSARPLPAVAAGETRAAPLEDVDGRAVVIDTPAMADGARQVEVGGDLEALPTLIPDGTPDDSKPAGVPFFGQLVADDHQDSTRPLLVRMTLATTLEVCVRDASGTPLADAALEVRANVSLIQGFSSGGGTALWNGSANAEGCAIFRDLPSGVSLELRVSREGSGEGPPAETVYLTPGGRLRVDLVAR